MIGMVWFEALGVWMRRRWGRSHFEVALVLNAVTPLIALKMWVHRPEELPLMVDVTLLMLMVTASLVGLANAAWCWEAARRHNRPGMVAGLMEGSGSVFRVGVWVLQLMAVVFVLAEALRLGPAELARGTLNAGLMLMMVRGWKVEHEPPVRMVGAAGHA